MSVVALFQDIPRVGMADASFREEEVSAAVTGSDLLSNTHKNFIFDVRLSEGNVARRIL